MSSIFLFWPRESECNDGTGNHCEFAVIIYQCYLLTYLVLLICAIAPFDPPTLKTLP